MVLYVIPTAGATDARPEIGGLPSQVIPILNWRGGVGETNSNTGSYQDPPVGVVNGPLLNKHQGL